MKKSTTLSTTRYQTSQSRYSSTQSKSQVKAASDLKLYAKKLYQEQCSTTKENDLLVHINSSLLILQTKQLSETSCMPPFSFKNPQLNVHRNNNNSSNTRLSTLNTSTIFLLGLKNRENIKLKQQVLQQQTTKLKALEEKTNKFNDQLHQLLLRYEVMDHSKNIVNQTFCYYQNSFQELNSLLNTHTQQIDQWTERVNCIRLRTMGGVSR